MSSSPTIPDIFFEPIAPAIRLQLLFFEVLPRDFVLHSIYFPLEYFSSSCSGTSLYLATFPNSGHVSLHEERRWGYRRRLFCLPLMQSYRGPLPPPPFPPLSRPLLSNLTGKQIVLPATFKWVASFNIGMCAFYHRFPAGYQIWTRMSYIRKGFRRRLAH